MIHINMVSISGSWSNSRSNTKNSGKWLNAQLSFVIIPKVLGKAHCTIVFCYYTKVYLNGKKCYIAKLTTMYML